MKSVNLIIFTFVMLCTLFSCKKDDDVVTPVLLIPPPPVTYPDYSKLDTGNYWIYQRFTTDSLGNGTPTNTYDSCYIEKDTMINNKKYYKYVQPGYSPGYTIVYFLRDSLSYVVTNAGDIRFSSANFNTIFFSHYSTLIPASDTVCYITKRMSDKNYSMVVPAGTYITSSFQTKYKMYYPFTAGGYNRYQNTRYAKDIGIVSETLDFYANSPIYSERRLVRYHLN